MVTVLLPPSETKHAGGEGPPLELSALALPGLEERRRGVVEALVALSADEDEAARILKLGVRQRDQVAVNARLRTAPTMPAVDRYTGVLYDALDARTLEGAARAWVETHVLIHSAPFGPIGAGDLIPDYRLAAATSLPGIGPAKRWWSASVTAEIDRAAPGFVLDLRSEAYRALGPLPASVPSAFVRIVEEGSDGTVRALNHFNKRTKGILLRRLSSCGQGDVDGRDVRAALTACGFRVRADETQWQVSLPASQS